MMKNLLIVSVFFVSLFNAFGQNEKKTSYFINLPPLLASSFEVGKEVTSNPNQALDLVGGIVINSNHLSSFHQSDTDYKFDHRAGIYLKSGLKLIGRKSFNKIGPYFGVFGSVGLGFEKARSLSFPFNQPVLIGEPFWKTSFAGGVGVNFGIVPNLNSKVGIEPGVQIGLGLSNQLDSHNYIPGIGRNILGISFQGVLKFRLHKYEKVSLI